MNISIYCNETIFECSYSGWNNICTDIIKSAELYFTRMQILSDYNMNQTKFFSTSLQEIIERKDNTEIKNIYIDNNYYKDVIVYEDKIMYEDSKDICNLLDNIKSIVKEVHSNYTYEAIYCSNKMPNDCLYDVFKEGFLKQENVVVFCKNNIIL